MILKFLLEKEFKQFLRHPFLPRMALFFPLMVMLVMPFAANLEVNKINIIVIDNDKSPLSSRFIQKLFSSGYLNPTIFEDSYEQALKRIDSGDADIIIDIPANFEKKLINNEAVSVFIAADTVNGTKGGMGSSYVTSIIADFSNNLRLEFLPQLVKNRTPNFSIIPLFLFNPHLQYTTFMVPALMVMTMLMLCGFLPALNIVTEKEKGTIEQINVTPTGRFVFIAAKLIPYWIIGLIALTIGFVVAFFIFGLLPAGNIFILYAFSFLFILAISGFGLVISNYAVSMQQAMFMMYFFIMLWIYLSGLFTPVRSMPNWAQMIAAYSPFKYIIEVYRAIYLKGSRFNELITQFWALVAFSFFFYTWAIVSYKKTK